jgi:hypothetical protein
MLLSTTSIGPATPCRGPPEIVKYAPWIVLCAKRGGLLRLCKAFTRSTVRRRQILALSAVPLLALLSRGAAVLPNAVGKRRTTRCSRRALRYIAAAAAGIWGMSSKMVLPTGLRYCMNGLALKFHASTGAS